MSVRSSRVLRYGLTFAAGLVLGAPLVAPFAIYLIERNYRIEGLTEWSRRNLGK